MKQRFYSIERMKTMKKYNVLGNTSVTVCVTVEADSEEEAMNKANEQFNGIHSYGGNGGLDKLIGVNGSNESIAADESVEFDDVMED